MWQVELKVANLAVKKSEQYLLAKVNMQISSGQIIHIQGKNGVGKTTLLRTICGLTPTEDGNIIYNQKTLRNNQMAACDYHYIGHQLGIDLSLSVQDNIKLICAYYDIKWQEQSSHDLLTKVKLEKHKNVQVRQLSSGQKKRLAIVRLSLLVKPVWFLDEVFTALDKEAIELVNSMIQSHIQQGGMVLLTSHQDLSLDAKTTIINLDDFAVNTTIWSNI